MEDQLITLEGHAPSLKEVTGYIILTLPGAAIGLAMLAIVVLYLVWSSLKAGFYYSKGLGIREAFMKGFYKSGFKTAPASVTRVVFICGLVLSFLICAFRGIVGFIYVSL